MGKIYQLHWQFKDRTEMKSQDCPGTKEAMRKWIKDARLKFSLPNGAEWLTWLVLSGTILWGPAVVGRYITILPARRTHCRKRVFLTFQIQG